VTEDVIIPRIVHQVWLGPDPLPDEFARYRETWREHHPSWDVRLWTEDNLPPDLIRTEVYDRLRHPVERSDILRLELVYRYGGVYVDTDVECLRPIDPLLAGVSLFVERLNSGRLTHPIMGGVPGHGLLERAIRELEPREFYGYDKQTSGPDYLASFVADDPGVTIFATEVFFPRTPAERRSAYAVHHAARSWKDAEGFRKDANMAERRLMRTQNQLDDLERRHRETLAELEVLRARLGAAESLLGGGSAGTRLARRGRVLLAAIRLAGIRVPRRLRAAAGRVRRKLPGTSRG
jgi:hypothetical protein